MRKGGAQSNWLFAEAGKQDEVIGEGPPVTELHVESLSSEQLQPKEKIPSSTKTSKQHGVPRGKCFAQLIGGRCMINCHLNGVKLQMLLDSGAQVSIVEKAWVQKALPNINIQPLESLLPDHPLKVTAANGTEVPFVGWIEVLLEITSDQHGTVNLQVPMLVSQESLSSPLLGFNVIQEIIKESSQQPDGVSLVDLFSEALKIKRNNVETLISVVQTMPLQEESEGSRVRVGKKGLTVPSSQICEVRCHIRDFPRGGTMLFEPDVECSLPDGLELFPALVDVPAGCSKIVKIPVQNSTQEGYLLTSKADLRLS